jgi:hypothetical protein
LPREHQTQQKPTPNRKSDHGRQDVSFRPKTKTLLQWKTAAASYLGVKTETVNFGYRESFSKFYRNLGLNGNGNGYRKYGNGIGRKNRKQKRFSSLPTVSGNYRFYSVFYRR